jgi:LemA protein
MILGAVFLILIVLIAAITTVVLYNALIAHKNEVDNMMGSIDAILKKRYDLIPNLVTVVKQYSAFEKSLLEKLTALRSHSLHSDLSIEEKSLLSTQMSGSLREFALTVENYPNLKANESFLHLQRSIAILEEELSAARRVYNQAVTDYNNAREMFPANIVANQMNLETKSVFSTADSEKTSVNINSLFNA